MIPQHPKISKELKLIVNIINQLFEIEKKVRKIVEPNSIDRNIKKLNEIFESGEFSEGIQLTYHDPIGENFDETRTDCEANIAGESTENLIITEVIKPIIRYSQQGSSLIIQKAVVIVESKD